MNLTVTEAQKKQIMILVAAFLSIIIYISGIRPMQSSVENNKIKLEQVKTQRSEMQAVVENIQIETNYAALREEYQTKFQERFENFKSNEIIEAITSERRHPIRSIKINNFVPVTTAIYENYIVQPKTQEELVAVRSDENSPIFPMLLCSQVDVSLELGLSDELSMYDAFNNVAPAGPGDGDRNRYCLLVPVMNLKNLSQGNMTQKSRITYNILVFAMETLDLTTWDEEFEARKQG